MHERINKYFTPQPLEEGETYLDSIIKNQIPFPNLRQLQKKELNPENIKDTSTITLTRHFSNHEADLIIPIKELAKDIITPSMIEMRQIMPAVNRENEHAGISDIYYLFQNDKSRFQQHVKYTDIPSSISPVIEKVEIKRYIFINNPVPSDNTFALVAFQNSPKIAKQLEIVDINHFNLIFLPTQIIATVDPDRVIKEITYEELFQSTRIQANFIDELEKATFLLLISRLSFKLQLGKILKPDYPKSLFSPEGDVTDNEMIVEKFTIEQSN